jgi:hypothetical protein
MGHSTDLAQRVAARLRPADGTASDSVAQIARDLQVSEKYVRAVRARLIEDGEGAAADAPLQLRPPRPTGGARRHLCTAENLKRLVDLVQANPKRTLAEIAERGTQQKLWNDPPAAWRRAHPDPGAVYVPSVATLSRQLAALGLKFQRAEYRDPMLSLTGDAHAAMMGDGAAPLTTQQRLHAIQLAEQRDFAHAQRTPGNVLNDPARLMFMDESTFMLTEQARRAWGAADEPPKLPREKNNRESVSLLLTIAPGHGIGAHAHSPLLCAVLRDAVEPGASPLLIQPSDGRIPDGGAANDAESVRDRTRALAQTSEAHAQYLREHGVGAMRIHGVLPMAGDPLAGLPELRARVKALRARGAIGLPILPELRSAADADGGGLSAKTVARYLRTHVRREWERLFGPTDGARDLARRCMVWDNAVAHGAVQARSTQTVSFWHHAMRPLIGIGNVVFLPARTPGKNPCETVFAYIKKHVRRHCPDAGVYTREQLWQEIQTALRRITPTMVDNWTRACGFGAGAVEAGAAGGAEQKQLPYPEPAGLSDMPLRCAQPDDGVHPRRRRIVCATPDGTIVKERPPGARPRDPDPAAPPEAHAWQFRVADPDDARWAEPLVDVANTRHRERRAVQELVRKQEVIDQHAAPATRRWVGPSAPAVDATGRKPDSAKAPGRTDMVRWLLQDVNTERQAAGHVALTTVPTLRKWMHAPPVLQALEVAGVAAGAEGGGGGGEYAIDAIEAVYRDPPTRSGRVRFALVRWKGAPGTVAERTWTELANLLQAATYDSWAPDFTAARQMTLAELTVAGTDFAARNGNAVQVRFAQPSHTLWVRATSEVLGPQLHARFVAQRNQLPERPRQTGEL